MKLHKSLLLLGTSMLLLTACDDTEDLDTSDEISEPEIEEVEDIDEPEVEEQEIEEQPFEVTVKPGEKVEFSEYTADILQAKIYENDNEYYADIIVQWQNQSPNDDVRFMMVGYFDVYQGEKLLKSIKDINTEYARQAKSLVTLPMDFTYQLKNNEDPITLKFGALKDEGTQEIIININE